MSTTNKTSKKTKKDFVLKDVLITYAILIAIGFIATLIDFCITKQFAYFVGWIFPVLFVVSGILLQQKGSDLLLKKAKEYGEHAKKPKGFMLYSILIFVFTYVLYVIPFVIEGTVSNAFNVSLTSENGWFNIYFSLGSTFILPLLLFMVKLIKYFINNRKK